MRKWVLVCLILCGALPARAFDDPRQNAAEDLMRRCEAVLWEAKLSSGAEVDEAMDPGHTGLVGVEYSPLTTSLGHLPDKRTAAQPAMAGAVAGYCLKAGLKADDWIAVNASGSFPGYVLATLCAAQILELKTLLVFSYGSSMYGGTVPEFTFPVALDILNAKGLLSMKIDAVAPGGAWDRMEEVLLEDGRPLVARLMSERPEKKIQEADFIKAVERRRELFLSRPVKAFVNCGGPWSSMGLNDDVLKVGHGLLRPYSPMPEEKDRGLIFDFLDLGVPVIHLLYTRGICADWGISYDGAAGPDSVR